MVGARPRFLLRTILLLTGTAAWCQNFDELAHGLAQKVAAALKPREPVVLSFRNLSSLSPSDAAACETILERELQVLGVDVAGRAQGSVEAAVTLSESPGHFVWVAEIRRGDERTAVIEERPTPPAVARTPSVEIEKKFLFEQDRRILDLAELARGLLVLDADAVSIYENSGGVWQRKVTIPIPLARPWPRDLRGRILVQGDVYQAYLPGMTCHGTAVNGLSITCRDGSLWPIGSGPGMLGFAQFAATRNFFDGRLVASDGSEKSVPAFFSAAGFTVRETTAWVLAGTDGVNYLYSLAKTGSAWQGWGSNLAGVESECGARSQVLATIRGDDRAPDAVRAYDLIDGDPRPVGEVAFSGPVTELWPAAGRGAAFAVSRDLNSGRYAAFRLAITCTH